MGVKSGDPIPRSAVLWNNMIDSANDFAQHRRLGDTAGRGPHAAPRSDIIRIKNSSGAHIRLGEILAINGFLLGNVNRSALWFDGAAASTTLAPAIALQDIPTSSIDRAQVSGACVALVNVTDTGHGYAAPAASNAVLQSAATGPVRILYKPSGTGEKTCAVLFAASVADPLKEFCRFTANAAFDTSDASVAGTIQTQWGHGTAHASSSATFNNLLTSTASTYLFEGDSSDAGLAFYTGSGTTWQIMQMECP